MTVQAKQLFNRHEAGGRLSRLLRFPLVRILVAIAFLMPAIALNNLMMIFVIEKLPPVAYEISHLSMLSIDLLMMLWLYRFYTRKIEGREALELSTDGALVEFGYGVAMAVGIIGLSWLLMWLNGGYELQSFNSPWVLLHAMFKFGLGAFLQVMMFRLVFFRLTEELLGTWLALVAASLFFASAHLLNGNMDAVSFFTMTFGDLLWAAAFILTRRLWLVWGLHAGWNFCQDGILGMPNSGLTELPSWINAVTSGPEWLSGGDYGLDGSLFNWGLTMVLGLWLFGMAWRRGQFVGPKWRRTDR